MATQEGIREEASTSEGAAFPWILEHLLTYPGTYEIPLRTMYTLNATTQNQQSPSVPTSPHVPGNAFPRTSTAPVDDAQNVTTATAAAQLRANLMAHISQLPSQPTSLPPSFVTSFVRRCFPPELDRIDFPQALTAMDYLKDLEVRRRREVVAGLDKLGIDRGDIAHQNKLARKYPGVLKWVMAIEEKERMVEALYTQVYIGLRRWTLINELSLTPFNRANCLAMLNTLYPPIGIQPGPFVPPTAQLTAQVLTTQRNGFFQYITAVERQGPSVLSSLIDQHKRMGEMTGWPNLRDTLDHYLRMANSIIDECCEITGRGDSPTGASFSSLDGDEEGRRKVDSAISFGSANSSNRNSSQSHITRPSTSSSYSSHNHQASKEKQLPEKPLPIPVDDDRTITLRPVGSTLERIARELKKIRSKGTMREGSRPRTASVPSHEFTMGDELEPPPSPPPTPGKDRTFRFKKTLRRMRSSGGIRDSNTDDHGMPGVPAFDVEEMKLQRQQWEAQRKIPGKSVDVVEVAP